MHTKQQRCLSFAKVHGYRLHQGLEQLQRQAGLWHWSASSPPHPPQPGAFGLNVQGTVVTLAWSFQFYKSDLSPRLTLMLIPSLVYGADNDVRGKCLKTELRSFRAMAELRILRGWVNGEGERQTKHMPGSLVRIPSNFNELHRQPFQINAQCEMRFLQMHMWDNNSVPWWNLEGRW